jgi:peptide/nickel transport system substrate-binding protein
VSTHHRQLLPACGLLERAGRLSPPKGENVSILSRRRGLAGAAGVVALATFLTACGGSKGPSTGGGGGGHPVRGGVLTLLGSGDVDYMDPNISYYTIGYLGLREWSRQLFTYPASGNGTSIAADAASTLPSTSNGGVSSNGLTYTIHLRSGLMWDTTPARAVTADDFIRGLKTTCNPSTPFGGQTDFNTLIVGYLTFCNGFAKVKATPSAIGKYTESHQISGVTAPNSTTLVFHLTHPATYFTNMLAMPAFSARPVEYDKYLPASAQLAQHTISDGPYKVQSYVPTRSIVFVRNPAWQASSDPIRHAYVNEIKVDETVAQTSAQQQLQTGTLDAMEWDDFPPPSVIPQLMTSHDPNFHLGSSYSNNPYLVFNTLGHVFNKVAVRQAVEYAMNRNDLIRVLGGPAVSPPLSQILPPGIDGYQKFDLYPHNMAKARSMLAAAGVHGGTVKILYRNASQGSTHVFLVTQSVLTSLGFHVTGIPAPSADFYTKYLFVPSVAHRGVWDVAIAGWGPDWYGNGALSFFNPLFTPAAFPPSGSNYGFLNDPVADGIIKRAAAAQTLSQSNSLWHQADMQVMKDAAIYPITYDNQPNYHSSKVHNAIYVPGIQGFDPTNVWLSK